MEIKMKYFFSAILVFNVHAFEAVVVSYQSNYSNALLAKNVLAKNFRFPEELIELKQTNCEADENVMIQICALEDGDFKLVQLNEYYVKNYFGEFIKKNGEKNELK